MKKYTGTTDKELHDYCMRLAAKLHNGHLDRQGNPYLMHLYRVAYGIPRHLINARCAGFLHDSVEDGKITLDGLRDLGIPDKVVDLVALCTHYPNDSYEEYVKNLGQDQNATEIKLSDLRDNQDPLRGPLSEKAKTKYEKAEEYLLGRRDMFALIERVRLVRTP